ncbi:DUF1232 domain-containing protein [soil metagenome]
MKLIDSLKQKARLLKQELRALWLASRDPRTPWLARALIVCVVAYAVSPIDLIPDPIPILGYLDDLILLPLGIVLALRLIPPVVMTECRERARQSELALPSRWKWAGAVLVVIVWISMATWIWLLLWPRR